MVNWSKLIDGTSSKTLKPFAERTISARKVTSLFAKTKYAGPFRELIRGEGGVERATTLTRKALKRRNLI